MATTAGGLPYPVGTDPLRDGDNAIKALADAVDGRLGNLRIEGALVFLTTSTAGNSAVAMLTFTRPFAAPPVVTASVGVNSSPIMVVALDYTNVTAAGANLVFQSLNGAVPPPGSVIRVYYIAVGPA